MPETTAPRSLARCAAKPAPQAMSSNRVPSATVSWSKTARLADRAEGSHRYAQSVAWSPQASPASRQAQLDLANQLASQQFYEQAADAYEQFLQHYPNFQQIEQVQLMLGLIYARYLSQHERAYQLLTQAVQRLPGEREIAMARTELQRIAPLISRTH